MAFKKNIFDVGQYYDDLSQCLVSLATKLATPPSKRAKRDNTVCVLHSCRIALWKLAPWIIDVAAFVGAVTSGSVCSKNSKEMGLEDSLKVVIVLGWRFEITIIIAKMSRFSRIYPHLNVYF